MKWYFHVDMDAFFASVEQLDYPELKGKPIIVGALPGHRGVVSACSYEARKFGIKSAMPISQAVRLCPDGIFQCVRMDRYQEMSKIIFTVLDKFSPEVQALSVDEAFLDMTGCERMFGPPHESAMKIKITVKEKTGLTISVGGAQNRLVAKMASDYNKPDGMTIVEPGQEIIFLDKLPLKSLWGLGKKTLARLNDLGIKTMTDLRAVPLQNLTTMTGQAGGIFLYNAVRGIDEGVFEGPVKNPSMGSETTFETDIRDSEAINRTILQIAHQLMFRLLDEEKSARTLTLKIRFWDYTTFTVSKTESRSYTSAEQIYELAKKLLTQKWDKRTPIRLIGLSLSSLEKFNPHEQQELFIASDEKTHKLEKAILGIKARFPEASPIKASLLKKDKKNRE